MAKNSIENMHELQLKDSSNLFVFEKIVRHVPGKRMVVFGKWGDKQVVAKLFYGSRKAQRLAERDKLGIIALKDAGIPTPALYHQDISQDGRIQVLLFEKINDAINSHESSKLQILQALVIELATQHVLGIVQKDLHFNNFLITNEKIYTIDGGDIEARGHVLEKSESIESLAVFMAQLGYKAKIFQHDLFALYAKARGWQLKPADYKELQSHIDRHQQFRWKKFQKKIFRNCSAFKKITSSSDLIMIDRQYDSENFRKFLTDPDDIFSQKNTELLKNGNSATVIKTSIDNHELVIKRYNIKNFWHGLRRCLRPTRAAVCWRLAQYLALMGISAAKPVAFIEKRIFGLRTHSYFIMENVSGEHIGHFYANNRCKQEEQKLVAEKIILLLNHLTDMGLTHGDLKMTNILIHNDQPVLIDLDGMKEHRCAYSLKRATNKEWKRFLANWKNLPAVYKLFRDCGKSK